MKWLSGIISSVRRVTKAQPGLRFLMLHTRLHRTRKGMVLTGMAVILGVGSILIGVVFRLVPGAIGTVLALAGVAALLAPFRLTASLCDASEVFVREIVHQWRLEHHRDSSRKY